MGCANRVEGYQNVLSKTQSQKKGLLRHIGTLKADVITGEPKCKYIVVVSLYNNKPVYFLSNACEKIQWTKKEGKLWHNEKG